MDKGSYKIKSFPRNRQMIAEATEQSRYYNHIVALTELDVTKAWEFIRSHKEKTGERLSFTAWVMKCIAQAVSEHKVMQTFRKGRRKVVVFDDVDIKCIVEKEVDGEKIAIAYVIRKANEKSFREIHNEIRGAQAHDEDQRAKEREIKNQQKRLMALPRFIRRIIWWRIMTDPFRIRKHLGTIGVTSMGMFAKGITGWAIPKTPHSTTFALGAVIRKPVVIDDKLEFRDFLSMTIECNHDIVDGAVGVRFGARLYELMENGFGLID